MIDWQLSTPRLLLRRLRVSDRPALLRIFGDLEVVRNLAAWPYPADEKRIDDLIKRHQTETPGGFGIVYGDDLAGLIGAGPRIGYMLAQRYWGLGITTEALAAVQKFAMTTLGFEALSGDAFIDNPASARVFEKCGWRETGRGESFSIARGETVQDRQFVKCARYDWLETIQTDRLTLRPIGLQDFDAIAEIVSDQDLADLLLWPWPYDAEILHDRLSSAKARAGLISAVTLNGETIGRVSAGGGNIGVMLRRKFWGKGYGTEAVRAKVAQAFQDPSIKDLTAGTWEGNLASLKLLTRLGFEKTGWSKVFSPVRNADIEGPDFTLTRAKWEMRQ